MSVNLLNLKPSNEVIFRCGGTAIVREVTHNAKHGDVDIIFMGECAAHNYLQNGHDYEQGKSLFDIVLVVDK